MKDIKLNNRIVQEKVERVTALFENVNPELRASGNTVGKYVFMAMLTSVFVYLFFVTSSIFYAINTQKYSYEIDRLNTLALEVGYNLQADKDLNPESQDLSKMLNKKERISYINKNADTAITLR